MRNRLYSGENWSDNHLRRRFYFYRQEIERMREGGSETERERGRAWEKDKKREREEGLGCPIGIPLREIVFSLSSVIYCNFTTADRKKAAWVFFLKRSHSDIRALARMLRWKFGHIQNFVYTRFWKRLNCTFDVIQRKLHY